jgi:hypothetical protein
MRAALRTVCTAAASAPASRGKASCAGSWTRRESCQEGWHGRAKRSRLCSTGPGSRRCCGNALRKGGGRRFNAWKRGCPMFDSPFEFCSVCRQYVLLDQTQVQCSHEHGCGGSVACPLARYFTGVDFAAARQAGEPPSHRRRSRPSRSNGGRRARASASPRPAACGTRRTRPSPRRPPRGRRGRVPPCRRRSRRQRRAA